MPSLFEGGSRRQTAPLDDQARWIQDIITETASLKVGAVILPFSQGRTLYACSTGVIMKRDGQTGPRLDDNRMSSVGELNPIERLSTDRLTRQIVRSAIPDAVQLCRLALHH